MAQPELRVVYVPDTERARYRPAPDEIVVGDAQISALARLLGPAIEACLEDDRRAEHGDAA